MPRTFFRLLLIAVILVLFQVTVFNHVCLFGVAVPFVFIYVILRLPVTLSVSWVLTVGFLLGLCVDAFSDTQGMNALACTLLAMLRKPVLALYFPREDELSNPEPSMVTLGSAVYVKYVLTMCVLYCLFIFIIESFLYFNLLKFILRVVCSALLSTVLLIAVDSLTVKRYAKRL